MRNSAKLNMRYKKGFGLLEVLISSVIVIIILGSLVMIGRAAMTNSGDTQERAQAIYLAQEGIEFVRQIRDTNWIDNDPTTKWDYLDGVNSSASTDKGCYKLFWSSSEDRYLLDPSSKTTPATVDECKDEAKEDIVVGVAGSSITYNRKIYVLNGNNNLTNMIPNGGGPNLSPYAIKVVAIVTWSGEEHSVQASELLTNWRPNY